MGFAENVTLRGLTPETDPRDSGPREVAIIALTRLPANCWRSFRQARPEEIAAAGFEAAPVALEDGAVLLI